MWRELVDEARSRVSVWWYIQQQKRAHPGWPRILRGPVGSVQGALDGHWDDFNDAPERLTAPQSALMHAWAADGLIGNGGMAALVESMGDRGPAIVQGFRALDLPEYAEAVDRALEVIAGWPPGGAEEAELERLETVTYSFADALPIKAVRFIEAHPADFPSSRAA